MGLRGHRFRVRTPLAIAAAIVLCAVGTTAAAWGIVSDGDNGPPTAQGAQAPPIGTLSANNVLPDQDEGAERLGDRSVGDNGPTGSPESETAGVGGAGGAGPAGGGGVSGLPFTGFLAIPLLAAGSALLLGGVALRRRTSQLRG